MLAMNAEDCAHACRDDKHIQQFLNQLSLCARDVLKAQAYVPGVFYWESGMAKQQVSPTSGPKRNRVWQTVFTKIVDPCFTELTMQCLVLMYEREDGWFAVRVRIQVQAGSLVRHGDLPAIRLAPLAQDPATVGSVVANTLRQTYEFPDTATELTAPMVAVIEDVLGEFDALRAP